jgi:hypothetical protein
MPEQTKFLAWHQDEIRGGLVGIRFQAGPGCAATNSTSEDFFWEMNEVNALVEQKRFVDRPDVF